MIQNKSDKKSILDKKQIRNKEIINKYGNIVFMPSIYAANDLITYFDFNLLDIVKDETDTYYMLGVPIKMLNKGWHKTVMPLTYNDIGIYYQNSFPLGSYYVKFKYMYYTEAPSELKQAVENLISELWSCEPYKNCNILFTLTALVANIKHEWINDMRNIAFKKNRLCFYYHTATKLHDAAYVLDKYSQKFNNKDERSGLNTGIICVYGVKNSIPAVIAFRSLPTVEAPRWP